MYIGTVLGLIFAILVQFYPHPETFPYFSIAMAAIGSLFLLIGPTLNALNLIPLQNAEQKTTPQVLDLYRKDLWIKVALGILVAFPILSYFFAIGESYFATTHVILGIWCFFLGVAVDALYFLTSRTALFLNPSKVVELFTHQANVSIQKQNDLELCQTIDSISEIAMKAAGQNKSSTSNICLGQLSTITKNFFDYTKFVPEKEDLKSIGVNDKASYILFYILQRIEQLNKTAIANRLDTVCSTIINTLTKITMSAAKYDISLASYPIHFLGRLALEAEANQIPDIGVKASCALLEIAENIPNNVNIAYAELQDPYLSIASYLDLLAKETFKQNKNINFQILTKPIRDFKALLTSEKFAGQQDVPVILQKVDSIIAEFETLDAVLRSMPLPNLSSLSNSEGKQ